MPDERAGDDRAPGRPRAEPGRGAIARDPVLSVGTVTFRIKNILRKLNAANRAEATSRYLRLTLKG